MLGQRYAFDFVQTDRSAKGMHFYKSSKLRYALLGAPLAACYGWGQPIFAPANGRVVETADGWPERDPVHLVHDLAFLLKNALTFDVSRPDLRPVVGNYIILDTQDGFAFLAHAQTGSIRVSVGANVVQGQHLANVGHSGNSTAPHLHFHLMDNPDLRRGVGIKCCFRSLEILKDGVWMPVDNAIPTATDRFRVL